MKTLNIFFLIALILFSSVSSMKKTNLGKKFTYKNVQQHQNDKCLEENVYCEYDEQCCSGYCEFKDPKYNNYCTDY